MFVLFNISYIFVKNKGMKNVYVLFLGILLSFLTGCRKEGCTDYFADNYNQSAKKNNGSCTYSEKFIIWQGYETSQLFQQEGITGLAVYIDGQLIGTFLTSNYWTATPSCEQSGLLNTIIDMGKNDSKMINLEFRDQDGISLYNENILITAGSCNHYEIL